MFMCRWPNGDVSFLSARNKEDAIIMLDEWDNAELAELRLIRDFMVDFRLTDKGELEFQSFGEDCQNEIFGKGNIRKAVEAERTRLVATKNPKLAETELGKTIQKQLGAPAALVDRRLKAVATEILAKSPISSRKQ